jgi:hypothetical protein
VRLYAFFRFRQGGTVISSRAKTSPLGLPSRFPEKSYGLEQGSDFMYKYRNTMADRFHRGENRFSSMPTESLSR